MSFSREEIDYGNKMLAAIKEYVFIEYLKYDSTCVDLILLVDPKDIKDLTMWMLSGDKNRDIELDWNWNMKIQERRRKRYQAKYPKPMSLVGGRSRIDVYLRDGKIGTYAFNSAIVHGISSPLHYVCQHIFDHFPSIARNIFYNTFEPIDIGKLHTLNGEILNVRSDYIAHGFLLTYEQCLEFENKFSTWIRYRNDEEKNA